MKKVIMAVLLAMLALPVFAQNSISLVSDVTQANGQATPTLTWDTSPGGANCVASGDWSGNKGMAGNETLPTITSSATYVLTCTWPNDSVFLSWTAPTHNTDGSLYTDPKGYKVYYGTNDGGPYSTNVIAIQDPNKTDLTISTLSPGTWYFVATAWNLNDVESVFSGQAQKTVTAGGEEVESVSVTINSQPNAVTDFEAS